MANSKQHPIERARVSDLQRQVWHMVFHCCAAGMWGHVIIYKLMYELMEMSDGNH
jgi:hypothetical protein